MTTLELKDIQGLLIRGHGQLPSAQYLLYRFGDAGKGKKYLRSILPFIANGDEKPDTRAYQLAFTFKGLEYLNLPTTALMSFSREFREGMTEANRQFILGDFHENSPENWEWGNEEIHLLLLVYARDAETLDEVLQEEAERAVLHQITLLHSLPTGFLLGQKEHFGFRDDISRPVIRELIGGKDLGHIPTFPAGEFIMGYKNLYDEYAPAPMVDPSDDINDLLPHNPDSKNLKDLGKNGTYLVFRQMSQNVFAFWEYLLAQGKTREEAIRLASKMVGRWPDGSPLVLCPENSDPSQSEANKFGYWEEDPNGLKCPIGAHIRRTNPRDHLVTERNKKDSSEMIAKHSMIRKGRPYGEPVADSMDPLEIIDKTEDHKERGLHFICMVTDIRRQFEFVQNNWVNFHKFGGLEHDADPIIGNHYQSENVVTDEFSMPAYPIKNRLKSLPNFTLIKGGAYFFFPGLNAIQFIADEK
ncbi:MAG: peroxidase [Cyclobacteriaceae bacterium]